MNDAPGVSTQQKSQKVIVVGGGLAGIAAAAALNSAGCAVMLLEARRELGGRASSFEDPQTAQLLDNCQHVLLGCCTNLLDLYDRLGVREKIRFENHVHFLDQTGRRFNLSGVDGLPAPLHLGPAMAKFGALSLHQRWDVVRAMMSMLRLGRAGREALESVPFGQWLQEHDQPDAVIEKFYDPILISALNEETRKASSKYAIAVFQDAMLTNRRGYCLGLPVCPLEELYASRPCDQVRLSTRVSELRFDGPRITGVMLTDGQMLEASAVVLATNFHALGRWIPETLQRSDARFAHLDKLQTVPILGAHLWFDRPVMTLSHAALLSGPLQWLFKKDLEGRVLHGVISAARSWVDVSHEQASAQFKEQIAKLFPDRPAELIRYKIIIEKRATFSPLPGADAHRPRQAPPAGGIENLFLAGDFTRTDWPATMEGAVRSGYLAAEAALAALKPGSGPVRFVVDDLPEEFPARLLAQRN
jgi:hydroxysqualene dehydroxylase